MHTVNVAILSAALGEAVGMRPNQVFDLTLAALLHDVGKQHTPLAILNKPGKLDDGERQQMEQHASVGAALLLARRGVPDVAPIVAMEHHANVDGTGYPRLRRNARPHVASQIVHVADVFDALRTNRPYRAAMDDARGPRDPDGRRGQAVRHGAARPVPEPSRHAAAGTRPAAGERVTSTARLRHVARGPSEMPKRFMA